MKTHKRTIVYILLVGSFLILSCKIGGAAAPSNTPTPLLPTAIPGWEKFSGGGIELWMPESFDGGDLTTDLDVIVARLRSLGSEYEQMAQTIEQNPSAFVLLIMDTNGAAGGFLTNVNVVKEQVLSTTTLDAYMDASTNQLTPIGFVVLDRQIVQLDNYQAGRLTIQADKLQAKELMYAIKNKSTMWVITYATGISMFQGLLPTFEQSVNTFTVLP